MASAVAAGVVGLWLREAELERPRDLHGTAYETAAACPRCHVERAASFERTFHRSMTRKAHGTDVKAPFAGEVVRYFGVPARMERNERGTPVMHLGGGAVPEQHVEVALTVGSRRYQQYVGRVGDALYRLPWAYHLEEQRWFHMNGAFLTPDPEPGAAGIGAADYLRHVTRWNDNCIFCHNVRPLPGFRGNTRDGAHFDSSVEEYGVGCEACHGPAAAHALQNRDPYRRYRLHLSSQPDPTIVNPARLSQERSLDVCGRCHGQRITDDVASYLRGGDPFLPGDDLSRFSAPLWRDTPLNGEEGHFATRFWGDGTPRLSAYEFQGILQSACIRGGELTCLSCHAMHAGDPRGQLRPELERDALCTQCHAQLSKPAARFEHSRHPADESEAGVRCTDCHMPALVYGVMSSHKSHRIEVPRPREDAARARPDACTLCHVDKPRAWAVQQRESLWPSGRGAPFDPSHADAAFSQAEQQLFGGDPVMRALTAAAYARGRVSTQDLPRVAALLLAVMEQDPYPGVRHLAYRSLRARFPALEATAFVPEAPLAERAVALHTLRLQLSPSPLDEPALQGLRARAADEAIDIGE
jgi:predicted CXXCH cytochrome family protein